jgi:glycosyltransferase involved in cell wall biosynthesis
MSKDLPRIALDTRGLEPGFKAHFGRGTGRYVECLTREFKNVPPEDLELSYLSSKDLKASHLQEQILSLSPLGKTTLECQYFFPKNIEKLKPDFIHFFSHGDAPAYPRTKQIVSILDLIPLRFPELYKDSSGGLRFQFARFLENKAAQSAAGIIAISEATKRDVVSILRIPEEKIIVTPLGIDEKFFIQPDTIEEREHIKNEARNELEFKNSDKILLYIGGIDPRKNMKFLLNCLKEAKNHPGGKDLILTLAGPIYKDKHFPEFEKSIKELNLEDSVKILGFLSDEKLLKLMLTSDLFIFPSLYEGFGLPVLEALSVGLPVIAGNNSSIPEVMGNHGIMLKDLDKNAWVNAILELTSNKLDPKTKHRLQNERIEHARKFTWSSTAEKTLEAYRYFIKNEKIS